ncbi:MAG: hydroxyacylglutathione hydrolase [Deltaproteobacteria bacterium]|nr:hydroxyacylglutathione hydrolase [Deltaproteobacteria bacterium]
MIQIVPVLADNYSYLIVCPKTKKAAVVDCPDSAPVLAVLQKSGWDFCAILDTHHHFDHVGGNENLLRYKKVDVYGSLYDKNRIPGLTKTLCEGDVVAVGELQGKVLEIPGHTLGHIAYYFEEMKALFCGDTLFVGGCGRLLEGTAEQMFQSLEKLKKLPDDTIIYCGHEYTKKNLEFALTIEPENKALQRRIKENPKAPSTIGEEKTYNPFLRCKDVAQFAKVRRAKDQF